MTQQTWNMLSLYGITRQKVKPEALNIHLHGNLRYIATSTPYMKADGIQLVPLLVGEFAQTMMSYPIIFAGKDKTPLAVMGLTAGENFFVKNGRFEEGAYVPACLRRHPFMLAGIGSEKLVVCIDRAAAGFVTEGEGEALFTNGRPSEFIEHVIAFLTELETEAARTRSFIDALNDAGLFEITNTAFNIEGWEEKAPVYYAVAEHRLRQLSDNQLAGLVRSGSMAAVDAHLLSLQRWNVLLARREPVLNYGTV